MKGNTTVKMTYRRISEGGHLFVKAIIEKKEVTMLIDTGASSTVFDIGTIKKILKQDVFQSHHNEAKGIGNVSLESHHTLFEVLQIGKIKIKNYKAVLIDLAHVNKLYSSFKIKKIAGIIGSDLLRKHKAEINFAKMEMKLSSYLKATK